jgi:hypothetical protein
VTGDPISAPSSPVAVPVPTRPGELTTGPIAAVNRFAGLSFAMPFFVLLGSLLAGRGLHQLHGSVVAGASTACPLRNDAT